MTKYLYINKEEGFVTDTPYDKEDFEKVTVEEYYDKIKGD